MIKDFYGDIFQRVLSITVADILNFFLISFIYNNCDIY